MPSFSSDYAWEGMSSSHTQISTRMRAPRTRRFISGEAGEGLVVSLKAHYGLCKASAIVFQILKRVTNVRSVRGNQGSLLAVVKVCRPQSGYVWRRVVRLRSFPLVRVKSFRSRKTTMPKCTVMCAPSAPPRFIPADTGEWMQFSCSDPKTSSPHV